MITVIQDLGLKEPFHSEINIQSGEIGDDFSYYFAVSEQTPSVVAVGVLVDKDYSCKIGGGFIVQMLPDATEDDYVFVDEVTRKVTSVTDLLLKYDNLEELMNSLFGELEYVEELPIKYNCGCSKEKFMSGIATLEEEEILDMIEKDKGAELECQICGKKYKLTEEDLKECIEIKKNK
jgi:molecular chaperone Hsp33